MTGRDTRRGVREAKTAAIADAVSHQPAPRPRSELDLSYAEQDYRVAMCDARDAYDAAVERAQAVREAAERRAEDALEAWRAKARRAADRRERYAVTLRGIERLDQLQAMYKNVVYTLSDAYAAHLQHDDRPEIEAKRDMLAAEIQRRENEVT